MDVGAANPKLTSANEPVQLTLMNGTGEGGGAVLPKEANL